MTDEDTLGFRLTMNYSDRASYSRNPAAVKLFELMAEKRSNLALAADVYDVEQLVEIVEEIGPHAAVIKTHVDSLDYDEVAERNNENLRDTVDNAIGRISDLAEEHNFMIFEDRKFADIGGVVFKQYGKGVFKIVNWAHLVNAHSVQGPGLIDGLYEVSQAYLAGNKEDVRGLIMLPYMTPKGNLTSQEYAQGTIDMCEDRYDFVMGWIGAGAPKGRLEHLVKVTPIGTAILTPGCKFPDPGKRNENERLGQEYTDPINLVSRGSDVIIVGSGIYNKEDRVKQAQIYRAEGWKAYEARLEK